mgnify:CR=1 FL=1
MSNRYTFEKDKLNPKNNQEPYNFSYGGNLQFYTPWNMTISTNMTNQARRGYSDPSMNRNELIWNAQIAQSFLKGALTLCFSQKWTAKGITSSRNLTALPPQKARRVCSRL